MVVREQAIVKLVSTYQDCLCKLQMNCNQSTWNSEKKGCNELIKLQMYYKKG